jgi:hypothetical protein
MQLVLKVTVCLSHRFYVWEKFYFILFQGSENIYHFCRASTSFAESDVQRSSAATPSDAGDNKIDYSFYVKYPGSSTPITQYILASLMKIELNAIQSESTLFFSLETSFRPPNPASPTAVQQSNTVDIEILNQQADQVLKQTVVHCQAQV